MTSVALAISIPEGVRAYTPHTPILIEGDANFTAANGVTGGSGTPADPYLIEGWEIDASAGKGIEVSSTNAHFVIRGVYIHSGGFLFDGIALDGVSNAAIESSTLEQDRRGIALAYSTNVTLTGNNVTSNVDHGVDLGNSANVTVTANNVYSNSGYGILLVSSTDITVADNDVSGNWDGIGLESSTNVTVASNSVSANDRLGIRAFLSTAITITANEASNGITGIRLEYSTDVLVAGNTVLANSLAGLALYASTNVTATANDASLNNGEGVYVHSSSNVTMTANDFTSNSRDGVYLWSSTNVTVTANNVTNNEIGIFVGSSANVIIEGSRVSSNDGGGVSLSGATYVMIGSTNVSSNNGDGISLASSANVTVNTSRVSLNNGEGIPLRSSTNVAINASDVFSNSGRGIYLYSSSNVSITASNVTSNTYGVHIVSSPNVTVSGSNLTSNSEYGISLRSSSNVTINANDVSSDSGRGIHLFSSTNVTITANTFLSNGLTLWGAALSHYNSHTVTPDNTVNGKPLYYHKDCNSVTVDGIPVGQLLVVNCTDVTARNLQITDTDMGILMAFSSRIVIAASNVSDNPYGLFLLYTSNVSIDSNDVYSSSIYGILLYSTANATVTTNDVSTTPISFGIYIDSCSNVWVAANNVTNGYHGVLLQFCTNATLTSNKVSLASDFGIFVRESTNVNLTANDASNNGNGISLVSSTNATVTSNNVSTSSIYGIHLVSSTRVVITANDASNSDHGIHLALSPDVVIASNDVSHSSYGTYLYKSDNVTIASLNASYSYRGIYVLYSAHVSVTSSILSNNAAGIYLHGSRDVTITANIVSNNVYGIHTGMSPDTSTNVTAHHNSLIKNLIQVRDEKGPENRWDDGYPGGGNYWSDYTGPDDCSGPAQDICPDPDGLGDLPYIIDFDSGDRYPLMTVPGDPAPPRLVAATLSGAGHQDLNLTWPRPGDESRPNGTNAYRILRAPSPAGPFAEIASVPADGSLSYTFTCFGCGHVPGDTNLTFYRIQAVNPANRTAESNVAARYAKSVSAGNNLLTVPLQQSDYGISAVLRTVSHATVRAYRAGDAADPWKAFYPLRPGDLAQTTFGEALWVDVTAPGQYTLAGLVRTNPSFALGPGWNLVAYASFVPETAGASLAGVAGVSRVEAFDPAGADSYGLRAESMAELLIPGGAYWVYVTGAGGVWVQD